MSRPRQISDEQIDDAARATFIEHGASAPVALVAAKLGVSHAALLQRAGSKEKLLLRSLCPAAPEVVQVVQRLREPPPKRGRSARLGELLGELFVFHKTVLPGLMVLRARGLPVSRARDVEPPTLLLRRLLSTWLVRTGVFAKSRADVLAEALLGSLEARCFNAYLGGGAFVAGGDARFIERLVAGLVPQLSKRTGDGEEGQR